MKTQIFHCLQIVLPLLCLFCIPNGLVFGSDPDALAPPLVISPIPAEYENENRGFQGIPSVTLSPNGRIWACWYAGGSGEGKDNYVLLASSGDKGQTWTKPLLAVTIPDASVRAYDPSMWTDPNGRVWLFWAQCACAQPNSTWDGRSGTWFMTTDTPDRVGADWSKPQRISDGIMMCKPIADSKGRWLLPISVWNIDPVHPDRTMPVGANVVVSEDQGKTWQQLGHATVPRPEALFDEHHLVERKDGSFWMLIRTRNGMAESTSTDAGKTWSEPKNVYPHTSSRFFVRRLQSGNLLFVKHGEIMEKTEKRSHLKAFLSDDDGKTWKGGLLLDERMNISYPDGDQAEDGTIFIIYDRERYRDREILMARFTEEDVLASKFVSPNSSTALLVNKASGPITQPK